MSSVNIIDKRSSRSIDQALITILEPIYERRDTVAEQIYAQEEHLERTFIMAKTDAVQRGLIGKVICKLQGRGFKLVATKLMKPSKELI